MTQFWRLTAHSDFSRLADIVQRLDEAGPEGMTSWSLFDEGEVARLDLIFDVEPDEAAVRRSAGLLDDMIIACGPMPEEDWVKLSLAGLKPVDAGRFVVFGEHDREQVSAEKIGLEIEAGPAFGTGHHGTTRGCLMAFDEMLSQGEGPKTVLDLGCGTAVLAIAAAKTLPDASILASDVDPESVEESQANCEKNGTPGIEVILAEGLDHERLAGREFELIFANILARPLVDLAPDIAKALAPGGKVILSGLLTEQEEWVRGAFEAAGLNVFRRDPIEDWETLVAAHR
ncbi:50S ribosomal protein L11 methyltransferase [Maricaulis sp.]|uniref:50S ribosomal protein L11 methyltransferase n=1 Tax=unclassified Maricaulis TaxID=2632371 RepID=UPI001B2A53BC|nr:50S ribosomal protein L11 methyltransferase [Maricaulis sp.]MBO6796715.1 50S ribosomal protein L11 methyltransferase [Maricaulis sp.]